MGIEIHQQGEAELYAKAGHAIGAAQKAEKEQALAVQHENMLIEVAERRRAEQASRDWEFQKMQLNSQQDFAHEQRLHQADLEGEARSKEWEVQKMELRSQADFQQEEQERQQKITRIKNAKLAIEREHDAGHFPDERQYQVLKNYYEIQESGVDAPPVGLIEPSQVKPQTIENYRNQLLAITGDAYKALDITSLENTVKGMGIDPSKLLQNSTTSVTNPVSTPVSGQTLDANTARQILIEAGGDKEKARQIARQKGYSF